RLRLRAAHLGGRAVDGRRLRTLAAPSRSNARRRRASRRARHNHPPPLVLTDDRHSAAGPLRQRRGPPARFAAVAYRSAIIAASLGSTAIFTVRASRSGAATSAERQ